MANKSDIGRDPTGRYTIGSRLSFDGALCTVRYIGPVQGTKGEWLGVEWDEPDRGKHSGAHNGVKYFQCKDQVTSCRNNHPTAGSFVRPSRPSDKSLSFLEGAHEKYVSELPVFHSSSKGDRVLEDYISKPIEISGKIVEEVGFDEVRKQLAALHELRILILDGLRINGVLAGPDVSDNREKELEKIKHTCPKVMELNLSRNLIRKWCEIVDICAQLPELKILKLNGNFFEEVKNCSSDTISSTVNSLFLDFTLMDWEEELSLDFNDFGSLDFLSHLTALRKLRHLSLRRNKISKIYASTPSDLVFSPTLEFVDVSCNQISSWGFLDALQKIFPGMTHLRISDNPLYALPPAPTKVTGLPEARMTVDEAFMLTLSRLSNLKILNYGKITPLDRLNGELYYLSLIRKEVLAHPPSMEQAIIRSHPRYKELCKIYEIPGIQRTEKDEQSRDIDPRSLEAQLIKFRFHLADSSKGEGKANTHVFEKEIPKSFDVYLIKAIVARHFSLPALRFKLIWESDEWDPVEKGTAEEDEWDSEDEDDEDEDTQPINGKQVRQANEKEFVRREEELTDSTREVSHWFASDVKEANVRVEPF
ncbi:tubulin-specific chaperone, putative [Trichophyton benhamiae CBS 112371]|uniref:Tubulin-specific chaperone, putative n=1 Tax=Arthroderma benhamiae (strain ATCC MYA-4681 / CBS 112371) TaxID=663331 RepID=D4AW33_ARTBC|nr:tubulin-specific chaperone, putative [Trichophyton benhamiae CBS 112371]EFE32573.1 tubulin-specific chaperone, putative [Trichophyton benhamiae CBS 112371]